MSCDTVFLIAESFRFYDFLMEICDTMPFFFLNGMSSNQQVEAKLVPFEVRKECGFNLQHSQSLLLMRFNHQHPVQNRTVMAPDLQQFVGCVDCLQLKVQQWCVT